MRILVIEDDIDIQNLLVGNLKELSFAVDATDCGERGSYLARTNDYDLIIMDYMLPKKNGPQICQEIRENGRMVPIIMLSVRSMVEDKIELFNYGADDYVAKPFSFEELYARIRAILRRPPDVKEPIIIIGDIVIDVDKQTVTKGKKNIYLTRKEFTLFHYLAQHKNTVVSRGMIMEHVWDVASDPFSNTIEAHILNVRKKLGGAKQKLIQTIPGRGYKLNAK